MFCWWDNVYAMLSSFYYEIDTNESIFPAVAFIPLNMKQMSTKSFLRDLER